MANIPENGPDEMCKTLQLLDNKAINACNNGCFNYSFELRTRANECFEIIFPERVEELKKRYQDLIRDMKDFIAK